MKKSEVRKKKRGRPPKVDGRDGKEMIANAALELFSTHGYSGTSLKMIADQVGFQPNALYAHFESKDHLRDHLLATYGPPAVNLEVQRPKILALLSDPRHALKDFLLRLASHWLSPNESRMFKFLLLENLRGDTDPHLQIIEMTKKLRQKLMIVIKGLVYANKLKSLDREWLCSQFLAPIIALRIEIALSQVPPPLEQVEKRLSRHIDIFFEVFGK